MNLSYLLEIEYYKGVDQSVRKSLKSLPDSILTTIDSLNWLEVKKMISINGYPNPRKDGFMGWELSVFFLHASMYSDQTNQEIIQIMENAQYNCLARKKFIAQMIDRRRDWKENKPQLYGLWNNWQDKGAYSKIFDVNNIDKRRFSYNLLRLEEASKVEKRKLPKAYIPSEYPEEYFCGWSFTK